MGITSATISLTRYHVEGDFAAPVIETVGRALKRHSISEIDDESNDKSVGWTSLQHPFAPDFDGSSFVVGSYFVFSLRIDKKSIPPKVLQKHQAIESAKRLTQSGRDFLSNNEKKQIKDHVLNLLSLRIPATPNIYDLLWNYEQHQLWFFTNLKSANEELETLFIQSFGLNLIRLFPYTMAELAADLSDSQKDGLKMLKPLHLAS